MAETELRVLGRQCLDRRIPDAPTLTQEIAAWERHRYEANCQVEVPDPLAAAWGAGGVCGRERLPDAGATLAEAWRPDAALRAQEPAQRMDHGGTRLDAPRPAQLPGAAGWRRHPGDGPNAPGGPWHGVTEGCGIAGRVRRRLPIGCDPLGGESPHGVARRANPPGPGLGPPTGVPPQAARWDLRQQGPPGTADDALPEHHRTWVSPAHDVPPHRGEVAPPYAPLLDQGTRLLMGQGCPRGRQPAGSSKPRCKAAGPLH
jgi:hypothetical protein